MKFSHLLLSLLTISLLASCGKDAKKQEETLVNGMQAQEAFSKFTTTPTGSCAEGNLKVNLLMFGTSKANKAATIILVLKNDHKAMILSEEEENNQVIVREFNHTSWSVDKTNLQINGFGTGTYSTYNDEPMLSITVSKGNRSKLGFINFEIDGVILEGTAQDMVFKSLESEDNMASCLVFEKELVK